MNVLPISFVSLCALAHAQDQVSLGDLSPGPHSNSLIAGAWSLGGQTVFAASERIWVTDGTAAGTVEIANVAYPSLGVGPTHVARLGDRLLVRSNHAELLVLAPPFTTGSVLATFQSLTLDTAPLSASSDGAFGSEFVFVADDGIAGPEPWITDGTVAGTRLLADITPGPSGSLFYSVGFHRIGSELFFAQQNQLTLTAEIWKTDGHTASLELGLPNGGIIEMAEAGGKIFFSRNGIAPGEQTVEVWDPATASHALLGTSLIAQNHTLHFMPFGDRVWFNATDAAAGREPWITDGTINGTYRIADLEPGPGWSGASAQARDEAVILDGKLVFRAQVGAEQRVYATDGTSAGTTVVMSSTTEDLYPLANAGTDAVWIGGYGHAADQYSIHLLDQNGPTQILSNADFAAVAAGRILFHRWDAATGFEPYIHFDGSSAVRTGPGCSLSGDSELRAERPTLGTTQTYYADNPPPGMLGALVIGTSGTNPLGTRCTSRFQPATAHALHWVAPTSPAANWSFALPLPMIPALSGVTIAAQAWFGPSPIDGGIELSNGLTVTFGL